MWTNGQVVSNHVAEKKDDDDDSSEFPTLHLQRPEFSPSRCPAAGMRDDDSSLPSSVSISLAPTRAPLDEALDMEERGAHDYFPQPGSFPPTKPREDRAEVTRKASVKCPVSKSFSVGEVFDCHHYDEAVMVENDSDSIESPRSDASSGSQPPESVVGRAEGRVGRQRKAGPRTVFELKPLENIHKTLYAPSLPTTGKTVRRARASSSSPYRPPSKGFTLSSDLTGSPCRLSARDDSTFYSSLAGLAGQRRQSPDFMTALAAVPVSSGALMQNSSYNLSDKSVASNTPAGEGKKKKKKKKEARDESAHEDGSLTKLCDENGNPVSRQQYLRLRQSSSTQHKAPTESSALVAVNNDSAAHKGDRNGMGNKSEDGKNSSSLDANGSSEKRSKRRRNGPQAQPAVEAQNYPDYVGFCEDVDTLVRFINNDIGKKKLKKSGNPAADNGDHGAPTVNSTAHKNNKAKLGSKQLLTTGVGESFSEDSLTPASETTQLLRASTSFTSYSSVNDHIALLASRSDLPSRQNHNDDPDTSSEIVQSASVAMGNSAASEKTLDSAEAATPPSPKAVENHIIDNILTKPADATKAVRVESEPNHVLSTGKSDSASKRGPAGETKGKGKPKNDGTNNHKKDSADDNHLNKKNKGKASKTGSRPESVSEKVSSSSVLETEKATSSADICRPDHSEKVTVSDIAPPSPSSPTILNAIHTELKVPNGPASAQDEEFTLVSTKKKKRAVQTRTQNFSAQTSSHPYSYKDLDLAYSPPQFTSDTLTYHKRGHWESSARRVAPQSQPGSSSLPPSSLDRMAGGDSAENVQDLSQSAFPALNPSDRGCGLFQFLGQEARSLEDLPCGVGQLSFDRDSDKASSKSLPAVQARGNRVNYPVSYASMASANTPRPSVDSSQAASISSSVDDSHGEESAVTPTSAMKWKGSPQERRHSIGSAPEELSKAVSGNGLQRTGSQEMLPRDKDSPDKASRTLTSPMNAPAVQNSDSPGVDDASQENSNLSLECSSATEAQASAAVSSSVEESIPAMPVVDPAAGSGAVSVPSVSSSPNTNPPSSLPSRCRAAQPGSSSTSLSALGTTAQKKAKMVRPVNNGNKKKIVIFCDDSEEETRGCDYIFGDLPVYWTSGRSLVMPSGADSTVGNGSKNTVTTELVSPAGCPPSVSTAANPSALTHTSTSNTVSDKLLSSLELPSASARGKDQDPAISSHSEIPLPVKASGGSAGHKDQPAVSDSTDMSRQCGVSSSGPSREGDRVSQSCGRGGGSKAVKGRHIAGLNGVIPPQGLLVSQADVHISSLTPAPIVSSSASIPATGVDSRTTEAVKEASPGAFSAAERGSVSSVILSAESRPERAAPSLQSTEGKDEGSGRWSLGPAQSSWPPYLAVQEPLDLKRQQIQEANCKYLFEAWNKCQDNLKKNPSKVFVYSDKDWMIQSDRG